MLILFRFVTSKGATMPYAFPSIFNTDHLTTDGYVKTENDRSTTPKINSMPLMTHTKTSPESFDYLHQLTQYFEKLNKNSSITLPGIDLSRDEVSEIIEELHALSDCFEE